MRNELEPNINIEPYAKSIDENNKLTDEEVSKVYQSFNKSNEREALEAAEAVTDAEEITENTPLEEIDVDSINETSDDVKEALSSYVSEPEDVAALLDVIQKYKDGYYDKDHNLFNDLPLKLKDLIDSAAMGELGGAPMNHAAYNQYKAARKSAAKMLIEDIINDAKMNSVVNEFEQSKEELLQYAKQQSQGLITEVTEDILKRIDQLKEMHPEKADYLERMKDVFTGNADFSKLIEILHHMSPSKLNKLSGRLNSEMQYFNTKVNNNIANVKVPDILEILQLLEIAMPQYDEDIIKKFVLLICRTVYLLDVKENFDDFIYIYRLVNGLYRYKFTNVEGEQSANDELMMKVSEVMDEIKSH